MPPPPPGTPTPTYTCNGDNPERYGWIRLTRAHTARTYHLMFCTENGWIEIQSGGSGAGRRLEVRTRSGLSLRIFANQMFN